MKPVKSVSNDSEAGSLFGVKEQKIKHYLQQMEDQRFFDNMARSTIRSNKRGEKQPSRGDSQKGSNKLSGPAKSKSVSLQKPDDSRVLSDFGYDSEENYDDFKDLRDVPHHDSKNREDFNFQSESKSYNNGISETKEGGSKYQKKVSPLEIMKQETKIERSASKDMSPEPKELNLKKQATQAEIKKNVIHKIPSPKDILSDEMPLGESRNDNTLDNLTLKDKEKKSEVASEKLRPVTMKTEKQTDQGPVKQKTGVSDPQKKAEKAEKAEGQVKAMTEQKKDSKGNLRADRDRDGNDPMLESDVIGKTETVKSASVRESHLSNKKDSRAEEMGKVATKPSSEGQQPSLELSPKDINLDGKDQGAKKQGTRTEGRKGDELVQKATGKTGKTGKEERAEDESIVLKPELDDTGEASSSQRFRKLQAKDKPDSVLPKDPRLVKKVATVDEQGQAKERPEENVRKLKTEGNNLVRVEDGHSASPIETKRTGVVPKKESVSSDMRQDEPERVVKSGSRKAETGKGEERSSKEGKDAGSRSKEKAEAASVSPELVGKGKESMPSKRDKSVKEYDVSAVSVGHRSDRGDRPATGPKEDKIPAIKQKTQEKTVDSYYDIKKREDEEARGKSKEKLPRIGKGKRHKKDRSSSRGSSREESVYYKMDGSSVTSSVMQSETVDEESEYEREQARRKRKEKKSKSRPRKEQESKSRKRKRKEKEKRKEKRKRRRSSSSSDGQTEDEKKEEIEKLRVSIDNLFELKKVPTEGFDVTGMISRFYTLMMDEAEGLSRKKMAVVVDLVNFYQNYVKKLLGENEAARKEGRGLESKVREGEARLKEAQHQVYLLTEERSEQARRVGQLNGSKASADHMVQHLEARYKDNVQRFKDMMKSLYDEFSFARKNEEHLGDKLGLLQQEYEGLYEENLGLRSDLASARFQEKDKGFEMDRLMQELRNVGMKNEALLKDRDNSEARIREFNLRVIELSDLKIEMENLKSTYYESQRNLERVKAELRQRDLELNDTYHKLKYHEGCVKMYKEENNRLIQRTDNDRDKFKERLDDLGANIFAKDFHFQSLAYAKGDDAVSNTTVKRVDFRTSTDTGAKPRNKSPSPENQLGANRTRNMQSRIQFNNSQETLKPKLTKASQNRSSGEREQDSAHLVVEYNRQLSNYQDKKTILDSMLCRVPDNPKSLGVSAANEGY